jgi:hypothetical protein
MPSPFPSIFRDDHWSGVWWIGIVGMVALLPVFGSPFANWLGGLLPAAIDGIDGFEIPSRDLIDGVQAGLRIAPCFVIFAVFALDSHSLTQRMGMAATYVMCHAALILFFVVGVSEGSISNPLYFSYHAYLSAFLAPAAAFLSAALAGVLRKSVRWVINPIAVASRSRSRRRSAFSSAPIWVFMTGFSIAYLACYSPIRDAAHREHWIESLVFSCLPAIGLAVTTLCSIGLVLGDFSSLKRIGFLSGIALAHLSVSLIAAASFMPWDLTEFPRMDFVKGVTPLTTVAVGTCVVLLLCIFFRNVGMRLATSRSVLPNGNIQDRGVRSRLTEG